MTTDNEPSKATVRQVREAIEKNKRQIYREYFFRIMSIGEFNMAWNLAIEGLAIQWREDQ